jgi:hypothetical protein
MTQNSFNRKTLSFGLCLANKNDKVKESQLGRAPTKVRRVLLCFLNRSGAATSQETKSSDGTELELEEHENYCGTRTDKCLECGELVMFKYKQIHMDSNHGFLKLKDGKFCRLFKLAAQTLYVDWSVQTKMNKILLLGIKMELSKYWYYQNVTFRYYIVYVK